MAHGSSSQSGRNGRRSITREAVRALAALEPDGPPVTSFYLDVDGRNRSPIECVEVTHQLVREARAKVAGTHGGTEISDLLGRDLDRVVQYVGAEFDRNGERGLAVFVSGAIGLFRAYPLACRVTDQIRLERRPYILPLARLLDEHPRALVVLVDREKARLFIVELCGIRELEHVEDDVPQRVHPESWYGLSDKKIERHVDDHIMHHYAHVAQVLQKTADEERPEHVLIGGAQDIVDGFREAVPHALAGVADTTLDGLMLISRADEVSRRAQAAIDEAVRARGEAIVAEILAMAGPAEGVAVGLEETLGALYRRTVRHLALDAELRNAGFVCTQCGRLFAAAGACPECGTASQHPLSDLLEAAVEEAYRQDARVTFIRGPAGVERWDGIGALLRYAEPTASASGRR